MRLKYVMIILPNWCFGLFLVHGVPDLLPPTGKENFQQRKDKQVQILKLVCTI